MGNAPQSGAFAIRAQRAVRGNLLGGDPHCLSRLGEMAHSGGDTGAGLELDADVVHRQLNAAKRLDRKSVV